MTDAAKFWNGIAERYARSPVRNMDAYDRTLDRTRSYLGAGDTVVEIGCGTGSTALRLADAVARYVATDVAENMVAIGHRKAKEQGAQNVELVTADLFDTPVAETPVDALLAFNLLHLVPDLDGALRHIHGMIRPGGLFISKTVCRPEAAGAWKFRLMMVVVSVLQVLGKAPYVRITPIAELERAVIGAGFEILETGNYPASPPSRFIVARKR